MNGNNKRIHIVYLLTSCKKSGPTQVVFNIIRNLDREQFDPVLVTIYDEGVNSQIANLLPYVSAHHLIKTKKKDILFNWTRALKNDLEKLDPDIIHTTGVFPDYATSRIAPGKQLISLHNFYYEDYYAKYGRMRGMILGKMQFSAIKKAECVIACSRSLSKIYKERLGMHFDFIRNGVDVDQYTETSPFDKSEIRTKLNLPSDAFIFVYTGQFIERKNVSFLLEHYVKQFGNDLHAVLLLLGGGPELEPLQKKYREYKCVDFRGNVSNVNEYLKACDVYVSPSKSEGLPNGVLEAMATGLPVVLSDIEQHKEFFEVDEHIGYLYKQGDGADLIDKLKLLYGTAAATAGKAACRVAHKAFSASEMSRQYQVLYKTICHKVTNV